MAYGKQGGRGAGIVVRLPLMVALIPLASCVAPGGARPPMVSQAPASRSDSAQRHPSARQAAPVVQPVPVTQDWQDETVAQGRWTYRADPTGAIAMFGAGDTRLSLRCEKATKRVILSVPGVGPDAGQGSITVRTSYGAVSWPSSGGRRRAPHRTPRSTKWPTAAGKSRSNGQGRSA